MSYKTHTHVFAVVVSMVLLFAWSDAYSIIIVTTVGERIQCEIVEDHDEYYIIDHDGYRRYLLKENVRVVEREMASPKETNPLYRHSFAAMWNTYRNFEDQDLSFGGGRIMYNFPLHLNIGLELNFHIADGTIREKLGSKLLPGTATLRGASISALWNTPIWRTHSFFETGFGRFEFTGETTEGHHLIQVATAKAMGVAPSGTDVAFKQNPDPGYGLIVGIGTLFPLTKHLSVEARVSTLIVDSRMREQYTFEPDASDPKWADGKHESTSELFMQLAQFNFGLRWAF
jgi:hypothetical protein